NTLAQLRAFVVGEEERPITRDRTAGRSAELSTIVSRRRFIARSEVVACIGRAAAEKPIESASNRIRTGMRHNVDLPGRISPERGVVCAGEDLEFANGVNRRPDSRCVELRIDIVDT